MLQQDLKLNDKVQVLCSLSTLEEMGIDIDVQLEIGKVTGFYPSGWIEIEVDGVRWDINPCYVELTKN